mmetsp:Transcript_33674/g.52391  ORF Transcript_33674/g.52391 Transcript_33674/m.52391 type:complete len:90 (-) Transcript_33674:170-439(-)
MGNSDNNGWTVRWGGGRHSSSSSSWAAVTLLALYMFDCTNMPVADGCCLSRSAMKESFLDNHSDMNSLGSAKGDANGNPPPKDETMIAI